VRIAFDFGKGVMLPMHGDPLSRTKPGRNPETETEDERHGGMQLERFVRRAAMEKDRGAEDGDLRDDGRREQAPGKLPEHATAYHITRYAVRSPS
jgi:hypothetical protein